MSDEVPSTPPVSEKPRGNLPAAVPVIPVKNGIPVMECPYCGGTAWAMGQTRLSHCGVCGISCDWALKDPRWKTLADKVFAAMRGSPALPDESTPRCESKVDGHACGSQNWAHDGKKLAYCTSCGANYPASRKQPDDLGKILKKLGPSIRERSPQIPGPATGQDMEKARARIAAGPK